MLARREYASASVHPVVEAGAHAVNVWPLTTCHVQQPPRFETWTNSLSIASPSSARNSSVRSIDMYTTTQPTINFRQRKSCKLGCQKPGKPREPKAPRPWRSDTDHKPSNNPLQADLIPVRESSLSRFQTFPRCKSKIRPKQVAVVSHNYKHFDSIDAMLNQYSSTSNLIREPASLSPQMSSNRSSRRSSATFTSTPPHSPSLSLDSSSSRPHPRRRRSEIPPSYIQCHTVTTPGSVDRTNSLNVHDQNAAVALDRPKRPSLAPQTLTWTSDSTRALEYAAIDRAHSGIRGFLRRILPGGCFRDGYRKFYRHGDEYEDDEDDARSVRRRRLRLSWEEASVGEKEEMSETSKGSPVVSRNRMVEARARR